MDEEKKYHHVNDTGYTTLSSNENAQTSTSKKYMSITRLIRDKEALLWSVELRRDNVEMADV
jgi:hypothetical protein